MKLMTRGLTRVSKTETNQYHSTKTTERSDFRSEWGVSMWPACRKGNNSGNEFL